MEADAFHLVTPVARYELDYILKRMMSFTGQPPTNAFLVGCSFFLCGCSALFGQAFSVLAPNMWQLPDSHFSNPISFESGDFNGDGRQDLIYATTSGLSVSLGNGDASFQPEMVVPLSAQIFGLVTADFNGDGKLDVAVSMGTSPPSVMVLLGNGDGTFGVSLQTSFPPGYNFAPALVAADFNNDGRIDLAAGRFIMLGLGDGTFRLASTLPSTILLAADFNHDGVPDVLTISAVLLGRGDGTFGPAVQSFSALLSSPVLARDFNNDGFLDLVQSQSYVRGTSSTSLAFGNGDGTFQPFQKVLDVSGPLAAADINGDGKLDLIAGIFLAPGNGDGTFRSPLQFAVEASSCAPSLCPTGSAFVTIADFNGDKRPDVALAYGVSVQLFGFSVIAVYINDSPGDGVLVPAVSAASGYSPVSFDSIVSAFGTDMAPAVEQAPDPANPPTTLGGIRVHIGTALAPLFYVSPTQINYLLPVSPDSLPTFSIERVAAPYREKGFVIPETSTTIGLFTLDKMLAAATAVRVAADGSQTPVAISSCSAAGCVPVPIDVSGDPVYLSLYGTGFATGIQGFAGPIRTVCNGTPTSYFGKQGVIPGLAQLNWRLPSNSRSGDYFINCEIMTTSNSPPLSNPVRVLIK